MTDYEILNDKEALNESKAKTKEHNIQNRLMAEKKMTEDLHASRIRFEEERKALLDEKENLLSSASDPEARKEIEKRMKARLDFLKKSEKRDIKQIKDTYHHDKFHRSFFSVLDAYLSRPPMWIVNLVTLAIFLGVFIYFAFNQKMFESTGHGWLQTIADFFKGLFVPDYDMFLGTGVYSFETSVVYLCLQTFAIAFLGTLFASILAVPFGFLASKKLFGKWSYFSTAVLILIRTVPEIVFCYIMIMVTGFSPITGVVVLSIQSIGMVGKMYSDGLDGMDMTFLEAYDSCGSTRFGSIRVGVLPQVLPSFLSTILYRFDLNLRTASILGLVGAGDLGRLILRFSSEHKWPQLGSLMWGLIVMIVLVDLVSTQIRKKLV